MNNVYLIFYELQELTEPVLYYDNVSGKQGHHPKETGRFSLYKEY